jgi:hypothetical protein
MGRARTLHVEFAVVTRRRSWIVIATVCLAVGTAEAAPSVGVDLSRLDSEAAADAAALEQALVIRLLQEGFAIDPLTGDPAIVVAIAGHEHEVVLSAKSAYFDQSRTIDVNGSSGAQLHLELVQKAVELARLAREAIPAPVLRDELQAERSVAREPRWRIGVDVGVIASEIETALHARYAIGYGFGAALRGSAVQRDATSIEVGEQDVLAGASYERAITNLVAIDIAVLAGVRRHHFELAMPLAERTGTRFDGTIALPLRLSLRPWRAVELSVWGIAKLARAREHADGDTALWHRDALGAGAGAGVAARF